MTNLNFLGLKVKMIPCHYVGMNSFFNFKSISEQNPKMKSKNPAKCFNLACRMAMTCFFIYAVHSTDYRRSTQDETQVGPIARQHTIQESRLNH